MSFRLSEKYWSKKVTRKRTTEEKSNTRETKRKRFDYNRVSETGTILNMSDAVSYFSDSENINIFNTTNIY